MCTKVGMIIEFIELRQITAKFLKHYFVFNWNFSPWPYDDFLGAIKMTKMTVSSSKNQLVVYFSKNLPWNFKTVLTLMCTSALCQEECHDVQLYTYDHGWCLLPEFSRIFSSIISKLFYSFEEKILFVILALHTLDFNNSQRKWKKSFKFVQGWQLKQNIRLWLFIIHSF